MTKMEQLRAALLSSMSGVLAISTSGLGARVLNLASVIRTGGGGVSDDDVRVALAPLLDDGSISEFSALMDEDDKSLRMGDPIVVQPQKGKAVALLSVRGIALYDLEWQPLAFSTRLLADRIRQVASDDAVGTIVMVINSPGGSVYGTQEAADAVWAARQSGKRVVAVVDPLTASAAYWIASQADEIVATPSADVGSIGVFMLHVDYSQLLEREGIKPTFIYDGDYKVEANMYEPLSEDARAFHQREVARIGGEFRKAVARGRKVSVADVKQDWGRGRVLGAAEAKRLGMIDRIESAQTTVQRLGVVPTSGDDARARRHTTTSEPMQFVQVTRGDDRLVYISAPWPDRTRLARAVLVSSHVVRHDDENNIVNFDVENGRATYDVVSSDEHTLELALISADYYGDPPPRDETTSEAVAVTPDRRRRLALLRAQ